MKETVTAGASKDLLENPSGLVFSSKEMRSASLELFSSSVASFFLGP
jgi:hypothetical protein